MLSEKLVIGPVTDPNPIIEGLEEVFKVSCRVIQGWILISFKGPYNQELRDKMIGFCNGINYYAGKING